MSVVELHAVTSVRQNLGYETLEFQQSFLGHIIFLSNAACVEHGRGPAVPVLCRLPLWLIEAPSIASSFHESFGRFSDIPSTPLIYTCYLHAANLRGYFTVAGAVTRRMK